MRASLREKSFSAHGAIEQRQTNRHGEYLGPQSKKKKFSKVSSVIAGLDPNATMTLGAPCESKIKRAGEFG
jgi:hypothetical protein